MEKGKIGGVIEWRRENLGQKKKEKLRKNELWQHPNETKGVQININNMANTWDISHKWNWPQSFFLMDWWDEPSLTNELMFHEILYLTHGWQWVS
jgi:hypothetical protein